MLVPGALLLGCLWANLQGQVMGGAKAGDASQGKGIGKGIRGTDK